MTMPLEPAPSAADFPAPIIRDAAPDDYDTAFLLFQTTMGTEFVLDRSLWEAVCRGEGHRAFIAEVNGTSVGMAVVVVSERVRLASGLRRTRFHLDELIVAPMHRRRGYAKALLEHVKQIASDHAPSYIIVNCDFMNVAARRAYEATGLSLVRQSSDRFEIAFSQP